MPLRTLVIFPSLCYNLSRVIPIPVVSLFVGRSKHVLGIFSYQLTPATLFSFDSFIISLGWFTQLYEVTAIIDFIRSHKKNAKILIGGLYAQLVYKTLFKKLDIDYFIKGDNEGPLDMYLEGIDPKIIPNMVGKDFENPLTYAFKKEDLGNIRYDLDWFSNYKNMLKKINSKEFSDSIANGSYTNSTPTKDNFSISEFLATAPSIHIPKTGCTVGTKHCKQICIAADEGMVNFNYGRRPLIMTNEQLIENLHRIQLKGFESVSLYCDADWIYDFSGRQFNLILKLTTCAPLSAENMSKIADSFKECWFLAPVHRKSVNWENRDQAMQLNGFLDFKKENVKKIYLEVFEREAENIKALEANDKIKVIPILDYWLSEDERNRTVEDQLDYDKMLELSRKEHEMTDPDLVFKSNQ